MPAYSLAPKDYTCPFCLIAQTGSDGNETREDTIVFKDKLVTAFMSSHWFPGVEGPVLVVPNTHYENVFDTPDDVLTHIALVAKKIAEAIMETYGCGGVSFRQHNLAGNQSVWHYHYHVIPRNEGDNLYQNHDKKYFVDYKKRLSYAVKLKKYLSKTL